MGEIIKDLISRQTCQTLNQLFSNLSSEHATLLDDIKGEILSNISQYAKMADFRRPVQKVETIFLKKAAHHSQDDQSILRRALVAKLALHLPDLLANMNLPTSILVLYPDAFGRLADFLKSAGNEPYDSTGDFFCKDVRFVLGLSICCGRIILDMNSHVTLPSAILSALRSGNFNGLIRYIRTGGTGTWFRGHVDSRYVTEFNELEACKVYFRVAELLERQKDVRGYVGTTWYFDPQLLNISPRLAYLQENLRERGAFFFRHGTEQSDIAMAIKTSETRRRLYQEGKYIPICYSVLWPRKELIAWAEQNK